jgi:nitrous oxidase accessory protein
MIALLPALALAAELVVGLDAPTVQAAVDQASAGDVVVLPEGRWPGPVRVTMPITLTSRGGVLVGTGEGTTLTVSAPGVIVDDLHVQGSGDDLSGPDACLFVEPSAAGTVVRNSLFTDCLFGIWLHHVIGVRVVDNQVEGRPGVHPSNKGNGIHLFDSEELVVRGNTVEHARDGIYVSATENSLIADNEVSNQRYGIHYMFSYDNTISGNVAENNSGGLALMGSHRLTVTANVATGNTKQGLLFRDVQYSTITGNRTTYNAEGLFFFSSLDNEISGNTIAYNEIGARVWAGSERNEVRGNAFVGNRQQVFYVAAEDQVWGSNHWSDYLGWDQDGDGLGDRPYRNDALVANLLYRYPSAALLLNSPTLELLSQLQTKLPALRVPTVIDEHPLLVWEW